MLLLYFLGVRKGEATGFQWRDVDFKNKMIRVERDVDYKTGKVGKVKTKAALRDIPLPDELYDVLSPLRGIGSAFIIQSPKPHSFLSESTFKRRWERLMQSVYDRCPDIESKVVKEFVDKQGNRVEVRTSILTAHYLRHNYASLLYDADVDILSAQKFLGHKDIKTTLAIYAHLSKKKIDRNADKVREIFRIKSSVAKSLP